MKDTIISSHADTDSKLKSMEFAISILQYQSHRMHGCFDNMAKWMEGVSFDSFLR